MAVLPDPSSSAESSRVQLGHLDIDPATLDGGGIGLWELVGTDRELDVRAPRDVLDALPATGWRQVHTRSAHPQLARRNTEMLAAPHAGTPGKWAVVNLAECDGRWLVSVSPGPLPVYPGRATRRRSLQLTWPTGLTAQAGTTPDLHVVLTNTSAQRWEDEIGEGAYVRAWLLDTAGKRIEKSPLFTFTGNDVTVLPGIDPACSVTLPARLATKELAGYPPGEYALDAVLVQLDLRCHPGRLTITRPSRAGEPLDMT